MKTELLESLVSGSISIEALWYAVVIPPHQ